MLIGKEFCKINVEEQGDVDFFEALLRKLQLLDKIDITPPKKYGFKANTVTYFPNLIKLLIKRLQTGQIQQLGIIADADYVSGGGFQQRWNTLTTHTPKTDIVFLQIHRSYLTRVVYFNITTVCQPSVYG